jgi:hypothetical protein
MHLVITNPILLQLVGLVMLADCQLIFSNHTISLNKIMNHVNQLIEDSSIRHLSSTEERTISEYLKSIPESDACKIIEEMVGKKSFASISIAKKVLRKKENTKRVFELRTVSSNAQSIRIWLDFAIPRIGVKTVVKSITLLNNKENQIIEKSLYWLPGLVPKDDQKSQELIQKLKVHVDMLNSVESSTE